MALSAEGVAAVRAQQAEWNLGNTAWRGLSWRDTSPGRPLSDQIGLGGPIIVGNGPGLEHLVLDAMVKREKQLWETGRSFCAVESNRSVGTSELCNEFSYGDS